MASPVILVVEDNSITQNTLKRDLTNLGFTVQQALSAEDAWVLLEKGPAPHIIILDFHLPGEDGPGFFRRITIDERFKTVVVIPFTALINNQPTHGMNTVHEFLASRDTADNGVSAMVSKGGREDVHSIPTALVISIGNALKKLDMSYPPQFRERIKVELNALSQD